MRYGYFDDENQEYVIQRPDVPVSWTNYLGVRDFCTVISHNAGGYSFYKSAEHQRITRFRQNGVPLDRPGHYVYLRDDQDGDFWSVSWQPVGKRLPPPGLPKIQESAGFGGGEEGEGKYEVRHGLSYTKFQCDYKGLHAEQLLFVPVQDDLEIWDVRVRNDSGRARQLSIFSYAEFSYHHIEIDNQNLQMSLYASGSSYADGIIEYDFFYEPWTHHFFTGDFAPDGFDAVRDFAPVERRRTPLPDTTRTRSAAPPAQGGAPTAEAPSAPGGDTSVAAATPSAQRGAGDSATADGDAAGAAGLAPAPEELYRQIYIEYSRREYQLALDESDAFLSEYPDDPLVQEILYLRGQSLVELGKQLEALKAQQEAMQTGLPV